MLSSVEDPLKYRNLSASDLIEILGMAGRTPPPDLIDAIWARRSDAEPQLLQIFIEAYDDDWENEDDPRWYRFVHAGKFMLAWQNVDALLTFVRLFSSHDPAMLDICEWFEEDLSYYGPVAIPALTQIIGSDSHNDWHYGRALAGAILTKIAKQYPESRAEIAAIFIDRLPPVEAIPEEHDLMWSIWAGELGELADEASREKVLALDSARVFSRDFFSRLGYLRDLKRGFQKIEREHYDIRAEYRLRYESESARARRLSPRLAQPRQESQGVTLTTEAKTGRNAPCPCGSGKKYKHCHGRPGATV